jgi:hypothetical protein
MLFQKSFDLGQNVLAIAAIDPLVNSAQVAEPLPRWAQNDAGYQGRIADTALPQIPARDRVKVASELAEIYERIDDPATADSWLRTAIGLAGDSESAKKLKSKATALEARIATETENASRRPVIQESLDQPGIVRPRIAATSKIEGAQQ